MEQGSPAWFAERCGKATASKIADVVARTKTGWGASRANYAAQLIAERLTGVAAEGWTSAEMRWGTETEPQARAAYEFYTGNSVAEVAFFHHPVIPMSGASPDGTIGEDGLLEIKCPNTATHIETLLGGSVASRYVTQMMWQMACTGRQWCDFVSFDPHMPEGMRFFCKRIARDDKVIAALEADIVVFLNEVAQKVTALQSLYGDLQEAA